MLIARRKELKPYLLFPTGIIIAVVGAFVIKGLIGAILIGLSSFTWIAAIIIIASNRQAEKEASLHIPTAMDEKAIQLLAEYRILQTERPDDEPAQLYRTLIARQPNLGAGKVQAVINDTRDGLIPGRLSLRSVIASILLRSYDNEHGKATAATMTEIADAATRVIPAKL